MPNVEFLTRLQEADKTADVDRAINGLEEELGNRLGWAPFGGCDNNSGIIQVATDPGRSLVERITNAIDAVLEAEHLKHQGMPECRNPREASTAWLNTPASGLHEMSTRERQILANRVVIRISSGEGRNGRTISIRDSGIGLLPEEMPNTILSLNESNKWKKYYLVGVFGQGGSSTLAVSKYTLIATRRFEESSIGFTLVRYEDLPADQYKTGHYVYLTLDGNVLTADIPLEKFALGTLVKHFGYDLSSYPSPLGPNSVYGLLNQVLFDPVMPIWLDDMVHSYRRVIKGSRNALNGAVDEGDEGKKGPSLDHHIPLFYVTVADYGRIGIEYWVLEAPESSKKKPTQAYVNDKKPVILTLNGQNHTELSQMLVKKDAELPYLAQRFICHVDCNSLTRSAKRSLFTSTREQARSGAVLELVHEELVKALKSDDGLARLNNEAKNQSLRQRDESEIQQMRKEVARLLRIHGLSLAEGVGGSPGSQSERTSRVVQTHGYRKPPAVIDLKEPPSFIRFVWDSEREVSFYPSQRRYMRIETDASSCYHDPANPSASRVNLIISDPNLTCCGTTPLSEGRMRAVLEASSSALPGEVGVLRIELTRLGLPTLSDERLYDIVEAPPARAEPVRSSMPDFEVRPIGPGDAMWGSLGWPEDLRLIASSTTMETGKLVIYYSEAYPNYATTRAALEQRDTAIANSFTKRYEIWLAVHSLLLYQDQIEAKDMANVDEDQLGEFERLERCRIAKLSALIAEKEARNQEVLVESDT